MDAEVVKEVRPKRPELVGVVWYEAETATWRSRFDPDHQAEAMSFAENSGMSCALVRIPSEDETLNDWKTIAKNMARRADSFRLGRITAAMLDAMIDEVLSKE